MLNVDPDKQSDQFYRYKMPKVLTKVESSGNGVKTVIVNIAAICDVINRNPEYAMKFLGHKLAVTMKFMDEKWIVTGRIEQSVVQQHLFEFITKFVLCKACRNPETIIQVDNQKRIWLNCKSCGRTTEVDGNDKLATFIIKTEQPVDVAGKGKKKGKEKSKDEKEEEAFNKQLRTATESDAIQSTEEEAKENPVLLLRKFSQQENVADQEVINKVFDMKQDYGLGDSDIVSLVFEALFFDSNISQQLTTKGKLLKRFLKPETEIDAIVNLMILCSEKEEMRRKFAPVLKKMFDLEIISEAAVMSWYNSKPIKAVKKDLQTSFKDQSKPFIEWLKNEEGEDEDEDEDDEEAEKNDD